MRADLAEVVDKRGHEGQTELHVHYQEHEPTLCRLAGAAAFAVLLCAHCSERGALLSSRTYVAGLRHLNACLCRRQTQTSSWTPSGLHHAAVEKTSSAGQAAAKFERVLQDRSLREAPWVLRSARCFTV